jgi:hypothetical protein
MRLVLVTFTLAVVVGYLCRGRLSSLGNLKVRWAPLAFIGLALQFAPLPGQAWPMAMLYLSFVLLFAFAIVNLGVAGFPLILIGVVLNFTVIAANNGMPVTRQALVASGQTSTLTYLIEHGGAKHHLAASGEHLLFLGDVIAVRPIQQAVSLGDIFTYGGVFWLIAAGMRRRDDEVTDPGVEAQHVAG